MANFKALLRGNREETLHFLAASGWRYPATCMLVILGGSGLYGSTVGLWRSTEQALYTAIKIPALILLTCTGNAILNGMLAQLLGSTLSFRQTSSAILLSFAAASAILGTFAPIALFVIWNTPALTATNAIIGHSIILLTHVFLIAWQFLRPDPLRGNFYEAVGRAITHLLSQH